MKKFIIALLAMASSAYAHEMTPTYFELKSYYLDGISYTKFHLFNRRTDVEYYEMAVFDSQWNELPFASNTKIVQMKYLTHKDIEIFLRNRDASKVHWVCSTSRLLKEDVKSTAIASRICSKVK